MTIKEIEEASGMQRANIRYYESEGFLNPQREKNGYRNYTEEDLEILKKIKLLRSLHISLEEIKAMHSGEQELGKTLKEHIATLTKQQEELAKSKYVCERMQQDGATYEKLNTEQYLQVLRSCRPGEAEQEKWMDADVPEKLGAPFLRMFARIFDYVLCMVLWLLLVVVLDEFIVLREQQLFRLTVCVIFGWTMLALPLDALFLHWFGATPGKMILGLKVTYNYGERIPMAMAWSRAWGAISLTHGWRYRELHSFPLEFIFNDMDSGKKMEWDYDAHTTIELKDEKGWRIVLWVVLLVTLLKAILELIHYILWV